jgi:hypothetical protein
LILTFPCGRRCFELRNDFRPVSPNARAGSGGNVAFCRHSMSVRRPGVELVHKFNERFRGLLGAEVRHKPPASRLAAHEANLKPHGSSGFDIVDHTPLFGAFVDRHT